MYIIILYIIKNILHKTELFQILQLKFYFIFNHIYDDDDDIINNNDILFYFNMIHEIVCLYYLIFFLFNFARYKKINNS